MLNILKIKTNPKFNNQVIKNYFNSEINKIKYESDFSSINMEVFWNIYN